MNHGFGQGAQSRRDILPAWVAGGGHGDGSPAPAGGSIVPVPFAVHTLGDLDPLDVKVLDPHLELRSEDEILNLINCLGEVGIKVGDVPQIELPDDLPLGYSLEDLLAGALELSPDLVLAREIWANLLAFYRPPRLGDILPSSWRSSDFVSNWGVYVHASGVETIARTVYLRLGFSHTDALGYALSDLLEHELTHAAFDHAALRLEASLGPLPGLGAHACSPCEREESLCEAQVARTARARAAASGLPPVRAAQFRMAAAIIESTASAGLPGYRDWSQVVEEPARSAVIDEVLGHDGVPELLARALFEETLRARVWVTDVPLYLILDPGTAAADGRWAADSLMNENAVALRAVRARGGPWHDRGPGSTRETDRP